MSKLTRRGYLKGIGTVGLLAGLDSFGIFTKILRQSLIESALAQTPTAGTTKNLVSIALLGAPPRSMWDTVIDRHPGNGGFAIMGNTFGNGANGFDYRTFAQTNAAGHTVQYPELWRMSAPLASGDKPFTELAKNHLTIRGIDSGSDGHADAAVPMLSSRPGAYSIDGMLGALSKRLLPSVLLSEVDDQNTGAYLRGVFKSPSGLGAKSLALRNARKRDPNVYVGDTSPMLSLSGAFNNRGESTPNVYGSGDNLSNVFLGRRAAMKEFVDKVGGAVKAEAQGRVSLTQAHQLAVQARATLEVGLGDVISSFEAKRLKYSALIQRVVNQSRNGLPGLTNYASARNANDLPDAFFNTEANTSSTSNKNYDLRNSIVLSENSLEVRIWAESFATIETLITQKMASSITLALVTPSVTGFHVGGSGIRLIHDAHKLGTIPHVVGFSLYWAIVTACIMELAHALEANAAGTWKDTVVYVNGDFGRGGYSDQEAPQGGGTSHERHAQCASIFSGSINGPICVGNITPGGEGGRGSMTQVGSKSLRLTPVHTANTLAAILGTEQPVRNAAEPLVEAGAGGKFVLRADVEPGKVK